MKQENYSHLTKYAGNDLNHNILRIILKKSGFITSNFIDTNFIFIYAAKYFEIWKKLLSDLFMILKGD